MSNKPQRKRPPELGPEFAAANDPKPKPGPAPAHAKPDDDLDHLDLSSWDYTPGGTIEQAVHTRLSNEGRTAYARANRSSDEHDPEEHYQRQMADDLDRRARAYDSWRDRREVRDESEAQATRGALKQQIDQQLQTLGERFGQAAPYRGKPGPER
jgi:hypothetical protein